MAIKIGGKDYRTKKPADLDARLLQSTGLSPKEIVLALRASPAPHLVARAVRPFLPDEAPSAVDLSSQIAMDGVIKVARDVAALFGDDEGKSADQSTATGTSV